MSRVLIIISLVSAATISVQGARAGRDRPPRLPAFAPSRLEFQPVPRVMLIALVVTGTFDDDQAIEIDARVAGVGAAVVALVFRAHIIAAMAIAAVVTALLRRRSDRDGRRSGPPPCQNTAAAAAASATNSPVR